MTDTDITLPEEKISARAMICETIYGGGGAEWDKQADIYHFIATDVEWSLIAENAIFYLGANLYCINSESAPVVSLELAAILEQCGEPTICCMADAALHLLCAHPEWRNAARQWLAPVMETWVEEWVEGRMGYRHLLQLIAPEYVDVLQWLPPDLLAEIAEFKAAPPSQAIH